MFTVTLFGSEDGEELVDVDEGVFSLMVNAFFGTSSDDRRWVKLEELRAVARAAIKATKTTNGFKIIAKNYKRH